MLRAALVPIALFGLSCSAPGSAPVDNAPASSAPVIASSAPPAAPVVPGPLPSVAFPLSPRGAAALAADRVSKYRDPRFAYITESRGQYVEDTFFVLAGDSSAPLDAAVEQTRKTVFALWHGNGGPSPFQYRPEHAVLIWLYGASKDMIRDLHTYAPMARRDGYGVYVPDRHEIYLSTDTAGIFTLNHELTHSLLTSDFPLSPKWLSEGLASLFELPDFSVPGEIHGQPFPRLDDLRVALKSPDTARLVSLDALFALSTDDAFSDNEALHYACARHALRWMDSRHQLWTWFHAYRDGVLTDPTGEKAFIATFGKTPTHANAEFVAFVRGPA
jgi:hypothetical protein